MLIMTELLTILLALSAKIGYGGIVFLMAVESSFIPLPSELIIPPAAYLASQGQMNIFLVVICGTFGSLLGALFNYILALSLGRKIVYAFIRSRYAKIFLLNEKHIVHAESFFIENGNLSTLVGRLLPGVRHLISIPAGFARMDIWNFILYTVFGAGSWTILLAILGYYFGAKQELIMRYTHEISIGFLILSGALILLYVVKRLKLKKKNIVSDRDQELKIDQ